MTSRYQALHAGPKFEVVRANGTVEYLTAKEFLARRARLNLEYPWAGHPAPGAGARRVQDPEGHPYRREASEHPNR